MHRLAPPRTRPIRSHPLTARAARPGRSALLLLAVAGATALGAAAAPGASAATRSAAHTAAHTAAGRAALVSDPTSLVNPFIGTENQADDFPGADAPFGMVQWSPDTPSRPDGGGYAYGDSSITGFSLTHVSGPGCGAAGDVPVLPTVGSVNTSATDGFSHAGESASPGYYSVTLANGVRTELTTTTRTGMARFTFPATTQANLVFKLTGSQNGDSNTQFNVVSGNEVSGQITSGSFCNATESYTLYFDMVFDQSFASNGTAAVPATLKAPTGGTASKNAPEPDNHPALHGTVPAKTAATPAAGANNGYVTFNTTSDQVVQAKVGVSFVSIANARADIAAENPNFDFASVQSAARSAWESLLGRVGVAGGSASQQTVFYTALYHASLHPNVISDSNGQYLGVDGKVHTVGSGHSAEYSNFSGWDIYRSQAQLTALVAPATASDIAQSMVDDYAAGGMLPKWMLNNGETYVMVGDPSDSILADYYAFGARGFDTATALKDMLAEADGTGNVRPGDDYLATLGYLPSNGSYGCCNFYGPASTTLEYDTADFAISAFAGALGDSADQSAMANRAQDWRNLYNPASGFIQPRDESGTFTGGFNPTSGGDFVEGDSWQYTPMVPFDLAGLIAAEGGDGPMNTFLNTDLSSLTGANGHTDLTNEPSLDIPWEYDYTGEPYNTQKVVRQIQDQIWTDAPNGLAGNDDLGTMSAWYVWSALGMYPETPGTADLALGSPEFTQIALTLPSGNTLTINAPAAADNAPYVQSATWNGAGWNNAYLPAPALTAGGTFGYTLGTSANTGWASGAGSAPPSYAGSGTGRFTDVGVSTDAAPAGADFDGVGYSYSATALANAGVAPGSPVTAAGSTFTWPNVAPGPLYSAQPDNYEAVGQTIPVSGSGSIAFLGAATNGPSSGTATVTYTDGTTQSVPLSFSDWTLGGGSGSVEAGNTIAVTTAYRNNANGAADQTKTYVFATTPTALTSGKTVAGVTLPASANQGGLHVFAIATGGSGAAAPTGPIVSGVSSGLCVDDSGSGTANGTHIQIWTCDQTGAQNWTVEPNGTLQVLGGCMTVSGGGTGAGTPVEYDACDGGAAQQWQQETAGLVNPASGLCLDDPGSSTTSGTQLQIWTCNQTGAQRWSLP